MMASASRLYGTSPDRNRDEEDQQIDDSRRILTRQKSNYAARGALLQLRFDGTTFELAQPVAAPGAGRWQCTLKPSVAP
jgi:hypothetical protein